MAAQNLCTPQDHPAHINDLGGTGKHHIGTQNGLLTNAATLYHNATRPNKGPVLHNDRCRLQGSAPTQTNTTTQVYVLAHLSATLGPGIHIVPHPIK